MTRENKDKSDGIKEDLQSENRQKKWKEKFK